MAIDLAFNPPQFLEEYDGLKMRQLVEELERLHAMLTADVDEDGVRHAVESFNGRFEVVVPIQADYDEWFLTPEEGDAAYIRQDGTSPPTTGIVDFGVNIDFDEAAAISWGSNEYIDLGTVGGGDADPNWANVILLLEFEGVDASTTFTDLSDSARTMVAQDDAQIDTDQAATGSSALLLDGANGDAVTTATHADFNFGSGDFTVECFVRYAVDPSTQQMYVTKYQNAGDEREWWMGTNSSATVLYFAYSTNGTVCCSIRLTPQE